MTLAVEASVAREAFARDGIYMTPPLLPADLIERAIAAQDRVINGEYATGVPPRNIFAAKDAPPDQLRKIDQSHLSDPGIREVIAHPAIGEAAAAITGARMVQAWATQLLVKPPNPSLSDKGNVGWHQDMFHWKNWWEERSEIFTVWIAISDVTAESGPVIYARGSNHWGLLNQGHFHGRDHEAFARDRKLPEGAVWEEVPAVLPPGAAVFHHRYTFHGSTANVSNGPRRSFAVHLRTEKSWPLPDSNYYFKDFTNEENCPVIYGRL